jgi:predicted ATPase/class 3 adenylate cyclase/uncharacterized protein HemY
VSGDPKRVPAFMFTDIEGSTQLWEKHREAMKRALARHDALLEQLISGHGGRVIKHLGDGIYAVFEQGDPLLCALEIQRRFQHEAWETIGELRIRVALHAGDAEERDGDYFGPVINRTARILSTGWGGQILLSSDMVRLYAMPKDANVQDLGIHMLKDLSEPQQIYGLMHPDLVLQEFPALRSLSARPHNLPAQSTPFIGRDEELAEIMRLLDDPACRLLTLVGPGGVGKTRLALQAAAEMIERFAHGVYFVPLDSVSSGSSLAFALADALKFSFYSSREDPETQLLNHLREKEMLLLLDNLEHLLEETGLLSKLLASSSQLKLLVTSQERLNLQGEWVLAVQGLPLPSAAERDGAESSSAVQLFVQSAQRAQTGFILSGEDRPYVLRICRLVEGMPLGIELAAAWVRMLPCREIAREIEQNLDFLATKMRNVQERHRSLRAVFEHSWDRLSEAEKHVLRRLPVFRGGFEREAAQRVAGASLPLLSALLDKSLLRRMPSGRHSVPELIRQYAEEKLKEDPALCEQIQSQHCLYYAEFLTRREEVLKRAEQREALWEIQEEIENVRASWNWAVEHERLEALSQALGSLHLYLDRKSRFQEGVEILESAIIRVRSTRQHDVLLGRLLARQGMFCFRLGRYERARGLLEESLALFSQRDDLSERALILSNLGSVAEAFGSYEQAQKLHEESLVLRRGIGDRWATALSLNNLGNLAYRLGEYPKAKSLYQESLALKKEIGDRKGTASSLNNLGNVAMALGEYAEAKQLYQESIAIKREMGDEWGLGLSLMNLGQVTEALQEHREAEKLYQESLALFREIGDRQGIASSLSNLGNLLSALGEHVQARQLYQESLALRRETGDRLGTVYCLNDLGSVAMDLGQEAEAQGHLGEALRTALTIQAVPAILASLSEMARFLAHSGEKERAVELLALALHHPAGDQGTKDGAQRLLEKLKSELPADVVSKAEQKGQALAPEKTAHEILAGS